MPQGTCRLCKSDTELQLSHIIPAFVYRWLRKSSGNGHIRSSIAPNLRVQDGPQEYWLCSECEGRFNRSETSFANQLFYPYLVSSGQQFRYDRWLLHFCASVSWRTLQYYLSRNNEEGFEPWAIVEIKRAEAAWRSFLLGHSPHPGVFRQHLVPFDQIESFSGNLPSNINRYLMRAIHIDLCHGGKTIFTYSKLGRFMILGFISEPNPNHWVGSKVNANQGTVEPKQYVFPAQFGDYLADKASSISNAMSSISDKQRQKIDQGFRSSVDRIVGSDFFRAMDADVKIFGSSAFAHRSDIDDESDR